MGHRVVLAATGTQGDVEQTERRSSETAGNAGSLPKRPFSSQKPPGLSQTGCNALGVVHDARVSRGRPPEETMGRQGGMGGAQGLREMLR